MEVRNLSTGSLITFQIGLDFKEGICIGPSKFHPGPGYYEVSSGNTIYSIRWNELWQSWIVVLPQN